MFLGLIQGVRENKDVELQILILMLEGGMEEELQNVFCKFCYLGILYLNSEKVMEI